jgi:hypothetical protein
MTAITQGTDIKPLNGAIIRRGTLGTTVTKGDPVTMQSDGFWDPSDASTVQLNVAVAVQGGVVTDEVDIVVRGPIQCLSGATPGALVYVSDTAGGYDTASGTKGTVVGYAESATVLFVQPQIIDFS